MKSLKALLHHQIRAAWKEQKRKSVTTRTKPSARFAFESVLKEPSDEKQSN